MRATATTHSNDDLFSAAEIARVARVPVRRVDRIVRSGEVIAFRQFIARPDAVRLVRELAANHGDERRARVALAPFTPPEPKRSAGLAVSIALHFLLFFGLLAASLWLFPPIAPAETTADVPQPRLVFLMEPGPGGGGGGGGEHAPMPASVAKVAALHFVRHSAPPVPLAVRHPIVRQPPAPTPKPPRPMRIVPDVHETPIVPAAPAIQAPVLPVRTDANDAAGLVASNAALPSPGQGSGGGAGAGLGGGSGPGQGDGLGPGSGGGTGGGPYRPGSGITAPRLVHEVRPVYTDEARRKAIEGSVALEIVVTHNGRVGSVKVVRTLPAGLEQKAIDAVRQWQFAPAERQGQPVDVVVQVSVEFTLR